MLNVNKKEECSARRIQKAMRLSALALAVSQMEGALWGAKASRGRARARTDARTRSRHRLRHWQHTPRQTTFFSLLRHLKIAKITPLPRGILNHIILQASFNCLNCPLNCLVPTSCKRQFAKPYPLIIYYPCTSAGFASDKP